MTFRELQVLVCRCTERTAPLFYRKLYGLLPNDSAMEIRTYSDWEQLPTFTKEHLITSPLSERTFRSPNDADIIVTSSGTSGKGIIFSPQSIDDDFNSRFRFHNPPRATLSSAPTAVLDAWLHSVHAPDSKFVIFDLHPDRVAASVKLACAANVEDIATTTSHSMTVAKAVAEAGINENIRYVEIGGERCSRTLLTFLTKTFPNAIIVPMYGSNDIETSPMGIACRPINEHNPQAVYHAKDGFYFEIIDSESGKILPIKKGVEGELLITTAAGDNAVFPSIRYRIGDTVRVVEEKCPEHGKWSFEILGRTEMDFVEVLGGILRADEIERVLLTLPEKVTDIFELHCYRKDTPEGPLFAPVLHVDPRSSNINLGDLALNIAKKLYVAPSFTYAQGVQEGRYLPFKCVILKKSTAIKKHLRIVQHE